MGLRDRGYVLDYYIPLFAGVDAAKRDRFRTRFPFSLYAPYISSGGTEIPGGIGGGNGGFGTPIDFSITTPSILTPVLDTVDETVCDSVTSSAFASSNGQTQKASRWMIETLAQDGDGLAINAATGIYIYDSGPDTTHLNTLPLTGIGLAPSQSYRVIVRYQGSDSGWSDWSVARVFTMADCSVDCGTTSTTEAYSFGFDANALTTHTGTIALPTRVLTWTGVKVYVQSGANWDDTGNVTGTLGTLSPNTVPATSLYIGPEVLLSEGTGDLSFSVTNLHAGGCSLAITLRITGHAP